MTLGNSGGLGFDDLVWVLFSSSVLCLEHEVNVLDVYYQAHHKEVANDSTHIRAHALYMHKVFLVSLGSADYT